jgi:hypothetical protein
LANILKINLAISSSLTSRLRGTTASHINTHGASATTNCRLNLLASGTGIQQIICPCGNLCSISGITKLSTRSINGGSARTSSKATSTDSHQGVNRSSCYALSAGFADRLLGKLPVTQQGCNVLLCWLKTSLTQNVANTTNKL